MSVMSATRTNAILLAVLLFGQLMLMSGSVQGAEGSTLLRNWLSRLTEPVVSAAGAVGGGIAGLVEGTDDLLAANSRNRRLEAEIERLSAELRITRGAATENARLRQLLTMRDNLVPLSIGASVVTSNLSGQTKMIVVDRGRSDGVRVDLPVVAWGGAVGRVVEAGDGHALVRLLTDHKNAVAGIVQGSDAKGMVVGQGTGVLKMLYVPRFSDVLHGDRIVTSGLEGVFPRGFGIGRVTEIHEEPDGSQTIQVIPELAYRTLDEVLILIEPVGGELLAPSGVERPR
jgi:rod shape-determining protein MreC